VKSIRVYLIVVILSVICLSNFIAALHGYQNSMQAADKLVDQQILEKAHSVSILVDKGLELPDSLYDENTLFQVWLEKKLIAQSINSPEHHFFEQGDGFHIVSYNGRRWRTYIVKSPRDHTTIIVAQRFDVYTSLTENILLEAILPIIWILPLVGVLVWLIVSLGLKPLRKLANSLNHRDVDDFATFDDSQYPGEMVTIIGSLNQLFLRLHKAFERERRFSADAAHELRTPLAALKVGLHNLSESSINDSSLSSLENSVERMGHSIEQLLAMHRVSSEHVPADLEDCDLNKIAKSVIAEMYGQIEEKQQTIELKGDSAHVSGEPFALSVLFRNLVDNASKYTPHNGFLRITIQEKPLSVNVLVEDSGPGIPESEYPRVIERFYRVGGDRHSSGVVGSGLGLSIVSFVTRLHRGQIFFSGSAALGGLAIEIIFPSIRNKVGL
jgi:two-component system sensor histidine kinase QseC